MENKEIEMALVKELGELQALYTLCDKSDENVKRGMRIKEIRNQLALVCKPHKTRRPTVVNFNKK